jgi:drug/metabolite transporter (DMT)-like permease
VLVTTTETTAPTQETRAWLPLAAVACTMVFWASAFVAIRHLGGSFDPGPLSLGRMLTGALALTGFMLAKGRWVRPTGQEWLRLLVIGLLWYAVYHVALNAGELRVDAGTASMLLQASPVLIALAAAVFLDEPFTRELGLGLALACVGVVLISTSGQGGAHGDLVGSLLCLVAAAAYVTSVILQKPMTGRMSALQITWLACSIGAVAQLVFLPGLIEQARDASAADLGWVLFLGVFPTAIAFTTYGYALQHMSAGSLGVTTYLVPPITIVLGLIFLGETPPPLAYVGGVLALVGVAITRRRPKPKVRV